MLLQEQVALAPYTTLGVGGPARWFGEAATEEDVVAAVAEAERLEVPLFVLGGGSNLLVQDAGFAGLVLRMAIRGVAEPEPGLMDVAAGEDWDGLVKLVTGKGYAGVECLAGIPGTVGGTPVQNVGAYGQEVADTIVSVRAYDRAGKAFVELSKEQCGFRYRQSVFNTTEKDRYIVTRVRYRLRPGGAATMTYADLHRHFTGRKIAPTVLELAEAVREIRRAKGMVISAKDPDTRSVGSFFKNPVVSRDALTRICVAVGVSELAIPKWPMGSGMIKLPAAWLLEQAGFYRGYKMGKAGVSSKHTLALINRGGASYADVDALARMIAETVKTKFGIELEREPVLLG